MTRSGERMAKRGRHPIGVVSSRTGLPQDVLRAWERRYDAVTPHRTETGRRLYSDADLEKLRLLKLAVESGRRISDVASLSIADLEALVREDRAAGVDAVRPPGKRSAGRDGAGSTFVREGLSAIEALDGSQLDHVLRQASVDLSLPALRSEVIRPLLETVGDRWREGSLRIANEHLATAVIRSFLGALRRDGRGRPGGEVIVLATPAGQRHELGALLAALAALEIGWDAVYLGPDLPAVEIAAAARLRDARAVALSIVGPASDPAVEQELIELRGLLGPETALIVGGASAESYRPVLGRVDAQLIDEPQRFQAVLDAL